MPWEKRILSERIKIKQNEIRKVKFKWGRESLKIRKVLSQEQSQVYQSIKESELGRVWVQEKAHKKQKTAWLTNGEVLDNVEGIPNTDEEL